jgi:signal transduction histidine kinase/CheY-like chemotaxis protein
MKSELVFALEQAGWPAFLVDSTNSICRANPLAVRLFGAALEGETPGLSAIWSPENGATAEQFLIRWERAPVATVPLKFRGKGGSPVSFPTAICAFSRDGQKFFLFQLLSEPASVPASPEAKNQEQGAEANLAHKHKLDCALQLARTVALDFNNALTSILGHTSLVLSQMEPEHPWRPSLLEVEKSASRAAEIANDLGTFSQQDKEPRAQSAGNLNLLLQRSVEFFQQTGEAAKGVWSLDLERRLFAARFDEAKMQQAFIKILENALEALPPNMGRVTIRTRNLELTEPTQDRNARLLAGSYVCVEIADSGCGIENEVLPRIFEPFFTTKKGTHHRGLGLAWVYGIVTNHGGNVAVSSQPGAGTSVRIYLPAEKRLVKDDGVSPGVGADLKGSESVLVVDDEDMVLTMSQTILSAYGYRVQTASSGPKALEILAQSESPIDLVITDLVMPTMGGRELVEHIRRVSPTTRILCTSGYVGSTYLDGDSVYLRKPFTTHELLVKVKHTLSADPASAVG